MAETRMQQLKDKLNKLLHQKELAAQKASMLEEQRDRDHGREEMMTQVLQQLMERQRELNIMLNRANLMLNRSQEANMVLSLEFTELCHALPAPEDPDVKDRIRRINDLFTKTGIQDAELLNQDIHSTQHATSDFVIVTPPPQGSAPETGSDRDDALDETTIEGVITEVTEEPQAEAEPVSEPEAEPTSVKIPPSLEELFKRTGIQMDEPPVDIPKPPAERPRPVVTPAPQTPISAAPPAPQPVAPRVVERPIPVQVDETPSADSDDASEEPEMAGSGRDRRWWQLLGRR